MTTRAQEFVIKAKKHVSDLIEIEKTTKIIVNQIIGRLDNYQVEWSNEYTSVDVEVELSLSPPYLELCDLFYQLSVDSSVSLEKALKKIGFTISCVKISDTGKSIRLRLGVI